MRARYIATRSRDVTIPAERAACNRGIVASMSSNEGRDWAFTFRTIPAAANASRHARTRVARLLMMFPLRQLHGANSRGLSSACSVAPDHRSVEVVAQVRPRVRAHHSGLPADVGSWPTSSVAGVRPEGIEPLDPAQWPSFTPSDADRPSTAARHSEKCPGADFPAWLERYLLSGLQQFVR